MLILNQDNVGFALNSTTRLKICAFCGFSFHDRQQCPAKEVTYYACEKKNIFRKFITQNLFKKLKVYPTINKPFSSINLCLILASCPASLIPASLPILIWDTLLTALVDSGSSESYVNSNISSNLD